MIKRIVGDMYQKTTQSVSVTVEPIFLKEGSKPEEEVFLWAYHVKVENHRGETIQLCHRYWRITDALGCVQEVRGVGVIGEQPRIAAGATYQYASGTTLPTPSGIMVGYYEMETELGERLMVDVPAFSLDSPYQKISLN